MDKDKTFHIFLCSFPSLHSLIVPLLLSRPMMNFISRSVIILSSKIVFAVFYVFFYHRLKWDANSLSYPLVFSQ